MDSSPAAKEAPGAVAALQNLLPAVDGGAGSMLLDFSLRLAQQIWQRQVLQAIQNLQNEPAADSGTKALSSGRGVGAKEEADFRTQCEQPVLWIGLSLRIRFGSTKKRPENNGVWAALLGFDLQRLSQSV